MRKKLTFETNHVRLCKGCIEMLKEYNPYEGTCYTVKEVPMEQCDNYTNDAGHFINLEKRYGEQS